MNREGEPGVLFYSAFHASGSGQLFWPANRDLFLSLPEARYLLDKWRVEYDQARAHSALAWRMPGTLAALLTGRPVGAPPRAPNQPSGRPHSVLSEQIAQEARVAQARPTGDGKMVDRPFRAGFTLPLSTGDRRRQLGFLLRTSL